MSLKSPSEYAEWDAFVKNELKQQLARSEFKTQVECLAGDKITLTKLCQEIQDADFVVLQQPAVAKNTVKYYIEKASEHAQDSERISHFGLDEHGGSVFDICEKINL